MKKVIVFGTFDPLHKGHIDFFKQAKKLGDYLTVVLARDENIKKLKKREPRVPQTKRLEALRKANIADQVVLGDLPGNYSVLEREKPDIIAVGYDQKIPQTLKEKLKNYIIIRLKPHKPEIYKSSRINAKIKNQISK